MKRRQTRFAVGTVLAAVVAGVSWYVYWDATRTKEPPVILTSTPPDVVNNLLEMAHVTRDDVVFDLGCGDGSIVIAAAKRYGCRAVGVEMRPEVVEAARRNAGEAGVADLVEIRQAEILATDLTEATVVAMYRLPELNDRFIRKLNHLKPGSRVVFCSFQLPGAPPKERVHWKDGKQEQAVYLLVAPISLPPK